MAATLLWSGRHPKKHRQKPENKAQGKRISQEMQDSMKCLARHPAHTTGEHRMTNTSQELTRTLKKARKARYFTDMHDLAMFAYAWKRPRHIDWGMTSSYASDLYDRVAQLMDAMTEEGKTLTACQRRLLTD